MSSHGSDKGFNKAQFSHLPNKQERSGAPPPPPQTGVTLKGRYRIIRTIGEGASCRVFEATRLPSGQRMAIKVLLNVTQVGLARFQRELEIHKRLKHANIVTLYDAGWLQRERPYLAMEYLDGASLEDLLDNRGHLEARHTISIAEGIAAGLGAMHDVGFVHRDLKPSNVFIGRVGGQGKLIVKLIDFGLSKGLKSRAGGVGTEDITKGGRVCGTPRYMAPEQVLGRGTTPGADVYALGCVIWEMLTGQAPFPDPQPSKVMVSQVEDPLPNLVDLLPHPQACPSPLRRLLYKMLDKNLERRPQDGREVLNALRDVRRELALYSSSPSHLARGGQVASSAIVRARRTGSYKGPGT